MCVINLVNLILVFVSVSQYDPSIQIPLKLKKKIKSIKKFVMITNILIQIIKNLIIKTPTSTLPTFFSSQKKCSWVNRTPTILLLFCLGFFSCSHHHLSPLRFIDRQKTLKWSQSLNDYINIIFFLLNQPPCSAQEDHLRDPPAHSSVYCRLGLTNAQTKQSASHVGTIEFEGGRGAKDDEDSRRLRNLHYKWCWHECPRFLLQRSGCGLGGVQGWNQEFFGERAS